MKADTMNLPEQQQFADTVSHYASQAQYAGAGAAVFFGLTLSDWGFLVGILIGIAGFIVNVYYKHRAQKMLEQKQAVELEILRANKVTYHKPED
jgi:hypothetical protein